VIEEFVLGLDLTPSAIPAPAQLIIFLLGWPLEWTEIIIIFVPIFLPLLPHFGSIRCSSACWWRSTCRPRS
jgi:TRAP-type mannitol/chloroaromatic compound transport system permease large subunit